jgi:hypothetical protein
MIGNNTITPKVVIKSITSKFDDGAQVYEVNVAAPALGLTDPTSPPPAKRA